MRERPILFSSPMVRAILEGRKTQTRRVVKVNPLYADPSAIHRDGSGESFIMWWGDRIPTPDETANKFYPNGGGVYCPYGKPGDRLWVRETWQYFDWTEDGEPFIAYAADGKVLRSLPPEDWAERLEDIWTYLSRQENYCIDRRAGDRKWRPSIHMPRWASRINLEITGVRVERLNDISRDDAVAEGVDWKSCPKYQSMENFQAQRMAEKMGKCCVLSLTIDYVGGYQKIWESINGPGSWDANPWVWVVEFKRVS